MPGSSPTSPGLRAGDSRSRLRHVLLHAEAYLTLLRAQLVVWRRPIGSLVSSSDSLALPGDPDPLPRSLLRIAGIVRTVAATVPVRPLCLVRSLTLAGLLGRHGFEDTRIRAGVRVVDGRLQGHAWVEYRGHPIGENPAALATFAPMANVHTDSFS